MRFVIAALLLVLSVPTISQTAKPDSHQDAKHVKETPAQFAKRTQWWRDARFGMFIHWGVYAVPADSSQGLAEWYYSNHTSDGKHMQMSEYQQFAPRFNPARFDAHKWVQMAKNAGMKYIVITSKHHDGFAMFGTKMNHDWNIVDATPFKRDPIKELADECRKQGIKLCFYHSIMDWHHPDYLPRRPWETETRPAAGANPDRYFNEYMKGQIRELLTNYGPIGVMWFDGEWENTWNHERGVDLYNYVRSLQPAIIVNNRVDKGREGMQGMNKGDEFAGDFGTPEQEIPAQGFKDGRLWESCMTMNDTWGYGRNDHNWKSAETLIHNLIDIASKGGNYLLNVGPTDLGEFPEAIQERLAEIGKWMDVHGAGIHDTTASPFRRLPFEGRCTTKGDKLYLHVFKWPEEGLRLQGLKTRVRSARALDGNESIGVSPVSGASDTILIPKPQKLDPYATTIELTLAGKPVVEETTALIAPNGAGELVLRASEAEINGSTARYESGNGKDNIGYWTNSEDSVSWSCKPAAGGRYRVQVVYACDNGSAGSEFIVAAGKHDVKGKVEPTGSWSDFKEAQLGEIELPSGRAEVTVKATTMPNGAVMNLREVRLTPVK